MKRKDEWSHDDDMFLAQTVLKHIANKSTQLNAFDEAADSLQRTSAACGFRWNSTVRHKYNPEIKAAKLKRRSNTSAGIPQNNLEITQKNDEKIDTPFDHIFHLLIDLKDEYLAMKQEIGQLKNQLKNTSTNSSSSSSTEDMHNLLQIIRRAEQLGMLEKISKQEKPTG